MNEKIKYIFIISITFLLTLVLVYATPLRYTDLLEPKVRDVDSTIFYEDYSKNPEKYIFIDVRPQEAYNNIHAKGSINKPLHTLYDERHVLPKNDKEIILICSGGRASGVGFSYLQHYGFTNIHRIEGGIERWIEKGLPTEKSI